MATEDKKVKKEKPIIGAAASEMLTLEPRIMLDAAAMATGAEVVADADLSVVDSNGLQLPEPFKPDEGPKDTAKFDADADKSADDAPTSNEPAAFQDKTEYEGVELVFVDKSIGDYQTLLAGISERSHDIHGNERMIEVIEIEPDADGILTISTVLSEYQNVDAIHILSHADSAQMNIGDTVLTNDNISEYANQFSQWQNALTENADILIYGCNVADGEAGLEFVNELAELTGSDIAASVNLTGHADLGGDFTLEYAVGTIESQMALSDYAMTHWNDVLAAELEVIKTITDGLVNGEALPGSTIEFTITIENVGDMDATDIVIEDLLSDNLTVTDIQVFPLSADDAYVTAGNTLLQVGTAINAPAVSYLGASVLDNDVGPANILSINTTSTQGTVQNFVLGAGPTAGTFSYVPPAGVTDFTDTFTYTVDIGNGATVETVDVFINVVGMVWFVDGSVGAGGDGTSTNPFNAINASTIGDSDTAGGLVTDLDNPNDFIYLVNHTSSQVDYASTLILENNQTVVGEGSALLGSDIDPLLSNFTLANAGIRPGIDILTFSGNGEAKGISITSAVNNDPLAINPEITISNSDVFSMSSATTPIQFFNNPLLNISFDSVIINTPSSSGISIIDAQAGSSFISASTTIINPGVGDIVLENSESSSFFDFGVTNIENTNAQAANVGLRIIDNDGIIQFNSLTYDAELSSAFMAIGAVQFVDNNLIIFGSSPSLNISVAGGAVSESALIIDNTEAAIGTTVSNVPGWVIESLIINTDANLNNGLIVRDISNGFEIQTGVVSGPTTQFATRGAIVLDTVENVVIGSNSSPSFEIFTGNNIGVNGNNVNNFEMYNTNINVDGSATALDNIGRINFTDLTGVVTIDNVNFVQTAGSGADGLRINNIDTNDLELTVMNSTITSVTQTFDNTAAIALFANNSTIKFDINNNRLGLNGLSSYGVEATVIDNGVLNGAIYDNGSTVGGIQAGIAGSISGVQINQASPDISTGGGEIVVAVTNNVINYDSNIPSQALGQDSINIKESSANPSVSLDATIKDNILYANRYSTFLENVGTQVNVDIDANEFHTAQKGLQADTFNSLELSLTNNTLFALNNAASEGIIINAFPNANAMNLDISNNDLTAATGTNIRLNINGAADLGIVGLTNNGSGAVQIRADIEALNTVDPSSVNVSFSGVADIGTVIDPQLPSFPAGFSPLQALNGENNINMVTDSISYDAVESILEAAKYYWIESGLSAEQLFNLNRISVEIQTLEPGILGESKGRQIILDDNASHYGWYVDDTPLDMTEFLIHDLPSVSDRMDLLTVMLHEIGHVLGHDDIPYDATSTTLMADKLETGTRILPDGYSAMTITEHEITHIFDAAVMHWLNSGISTAQHDLLNSVTFEVADIGNSKLGQQIGTHIIIDDNAGGYNWFVDQTPHDSHEFITLSENQFMATDTLAASNIDLLTVVMHEMGHVLNIPDNIDSNNLMNHSLSVGERFLPNSTQQIQDYTDPVNNAFLTAPDYVLTINELSPGETTTIVITTTVNDPNTSGQFDISNEVEVTYNNGSSLLTIGDQVSAPINSMFDLSIEKTAVNIPTIIDGGETIVFELVVSNNGNQNLTDVTVFDTLSDGFMADLGSPNNANWTSIGNNIFEYVIPGEFIAGTTQTLFFEATVVDFLPSFGLLTNSASVSDNGINGADIDLSNNVDGLSLEFDTIVDIQIDKTTTSVSPVSPDDTIVYDYLVSNLGNVTINNVVISDEISPYFIPNLSLSTSGWAETQPGSGVYELILASLADLPQTVSLIGTVLNPLPSGVVDLDNTVTVSYDNAFGADIDPTNNTDTLSLAVDAEPDLFIEKTILEGTGPFEPGDTITYSMQISNIGNQEATGVLLTEQLPSELVIDLQQNSGWINVGNGSYEYLIGSLMGAGESTTVTLVGTLLDVLPSGVDDLTNMAYVNDDGQNGIDPNMNNNMDSITVDLNAAPDIRVTKTPLPGDYVPGSNIEYEIIVENIGNQNATNITITDSILTPGVVIFDENLSSAQWQIVNPEVFTATFSDLIVGEPIMLTVVTNIINPQPAGIEAVTNTIIAMDDGSDGPDQNALDNTDSVSLEIDAAPDLRVSMMGEPEVVEQGDRIIYTISLDNIGNQNAKGVFLLQTISEEASFDGSNSSLGWIDNFDGTFTFTVGNVQAYDAAIAVDFAVMVNQPQSPFEFIESKVFITDDNSSGSDTNLFDNQAVSFTQVITANADLFARHWWQYFEAGRGISFPYMPVEHDSGLISLYTMDVRANLVGSHVMDNYDPAFGPQDFGAEHMRSIRFATSDAIYQEYISDIGQQYPGWTPHSELFEDGQFILRQVDHITDNLQEAINEARRDQEIASDSSDAAEGSSDNNNNKSVEAVNEKHYRTFSTQINSMSTQFERDKAAFAAAAARFTE